MSLLDTWREHLAWEGLNHVGVVGQARYDAAAPVELAAERVQPGTRSIVVIGSGGTAHWDRFLAYVAGDPEERLARRADPFDDFCAHVIADLFTRLAAPLEGTRALFPTYRSGFGGAGSLAKPTHLDFMKLAALAGLGQPSELGILVSDRFGPWFGLRAALFTPHALPETLPSRRACDGCAAPCRAACPPGLVGAGPGAFSWLRCGAERAHQGSPCGSRCGAREACIVAPEALYDALERTYHHDRVAGRRLLCARFGVIDRL